MAGVQVKSGTAATLTCTMTGVNGNEALTVTWLKDDAALTENDRTTLGITTPDSSKRYGGRVELIVPYDCSHQ